MTGALDVDEVVVVVGRAGQVPDGVGQFDHDVVPAPAQRGRGDVAQHAVFPAEPDSGLALVGVGVRDGVVGHGRAEAVGVGCDERDGGGRGGGVKVDQAPELATADRGPFLLAEAGGVLADPRGKPVAVARPPLHLPGGVQQLQRTGDLGHG